VIRGGIVDHRLEFAAREIVDARGRLLHAQKALRRHDDERARRHVERLLAQQVEVLRRRRAVDDADVLLCRELQEPLESRARMLGPLPS